jgi:hypothetical protein
MTPQTLPINPTPKQRFQQSNDNISKHKRLIEQPEFQRAIDYALREYGHRVNLDTENSPGTAGANSYRSLGAEQFVHELITLAETPPPPRAVVDTDNLREPSKIIGSLKGN